MKNPELNKLYKELKSYKNKAEILKNKRKEINFGVQDNYQDNERKNMELEKNIKILQRIKDRAERGRN